jgi:hypothetical protein
MSKLNIKNTGMASEQSLALGDCVMLINPAIASASVTVLPLAAVTIIAAKRMRLAGGDS